MHRIFLGSIIFLLGFILLLLVAFSWFSDIISEATFMGYHTLVVRTGLKSGFLLFIASEIMLFLGFFWAFFHSALSPSILFNVTWPPMGIAFIHAFHFPLLNTIILLVSGFSVTWVHRGLSLGSFKESIDGFILTLILGLTFLLIQIYEYKQQVLIFQILFMLVHFIC